MFVHYKKSITFAPHLSPDGGIGRRAGLKHQWGNPCRFDPGSGYLKAVKSSSTLNRFFFYSSAPAVISILVPPAKRSLIYPFTLLPFKALFTFQNPSCRFAQFMFFSLDS